MFSFFLLFRLRRPRTDSLELSENRHAPLPPQRDAPSIFTLTLLAPTAHLIKRLQSGLSAFGKTVRNLVLRRSFAGFFYPQGQHYEALALDGCSEGGCLDAPFRVSYFCLDARVKAANSSFLRRMGSFAVQGATS